MNVIYRILASLLQLLLIVDELVQILIRAPIYIVTGYNMPSAHETISAWVGSSAKENKAWAIEAQYLINSIFGKNHCQTAAEYEISIETPS